VSPEPSPIVGPITTDDYHTAGEPFRIVTGGVSVPEGADVPARRQWAATHLDLVRRLLVHEPRGHADMYGCFVTPPNDADADLGVVFFHNEGYSTACGHGTIALVTWAVETGRVAGPEIVVDVPSGRVRCVARIDDAGRVAAVRFHNVPSFASALDLEVATTRGPVAVDIGFGGAFYGVVDVRTLGLAVEPAALPALIALQRELRPALEASVEVVHPLETDLRGIYGVVFWEPATAPDGRTVAERNVTVFADGEVDRSPCGSGTSARLAVLHRRGTIDVGTPFVNRSVIDSVFTAGIDGTTEVAGVPAVATWVEGSAYRTGTHRFELDPRDPLGDGFLLR